MPKHVNERYNRPSYDLKNNTIRNAHYINEKKVFEEKVNIDTSCKLAITAQQHQQVEPEPVLLQQQVDPEPVFLQPQVDPKPVFLQQQVDPKPVCSQQQNSAQNVLDNLHFNNENMNTSHLSQQSLNVKELNLNFANLPDESKLKNSVSCFSSNEDEKIERDMMYDIFERSYHNDDTSFCSASNINNLTNISEDDENNDDSGDAASSALFDLKEVRLTQIFCEELKFL